MENQNLRKEENVCEGNDDEEEWQWWVRPRALLWFRHFFGLFHVWRRPCCSGTALHRPELTTETEAETHTVPKHPLKCARNQPSSIRHQHIIDFHSSGEQTHVVFLMLYTQVEWAWGFKFYSVANGFCGWREWPISFSIRSQYDIVVIIIITSKLKVKAIKTNKQTSIHISRFLSFGHTGMTWSSDHSVLKVSV